MPRIGRSGEEYRAIWHGMPVVLRRQAAAFFEELDAVELERLDVDPGQAYDDLPPRDIVLLAEEMRRRQNADSANDDVLKESREDLTGEA